VFNGNVSFGAGVIGGSGNITGGNLITSGLITATGNITGGNIATGGQITATGNITTTANISGGNLSVSGAFAPATMTATGNVAGGNLTTGGVVSAAGNIITAGYFVGNFAGNITGNLVVPGSNTQVLFNNAGNAGATAGLTFDTAGPNLLTVNGNVQSGNLLATGIVSVPQAM
jgi:hypothetical protein